MRLRTLCLASAGFCSATPLADQEPLTVTSNEPGTLEKGNPYTDPQAGIRYVSRDIQYLIQDLAQNNISEALYDYIPTRVFIAGTLWDEVMPADTSCAGFKIGPYPNTTNEAIQILQKVQLGLSIVSQDIINNASVELKRNDFCNGVLGPFWSVSCLEKDGFAKLLNGSFSAPARWTCKQYRYNQSGLVEQTSDKASTAVPIADLFDIDGHTDL